MTYIQNVSKTLTLFSALALIHGCGTSDTSTTSSITSEASSIVSSLEGVWTQACIASGSGFLKRELLFYSGGFLENAYYGHESTCTTVSAVTTRQMTYTMSNPYTLTTGQSVRQLNITISKQIITASTSETAIALNNELYCGYSTFHEDTEVDATYTTCGLDSKQYTIFTIDGQNLYLGTFSEAASAIVQTVDARPFVHSTTSSSDTGSNL